jgi:Flp pilus assembly pilin Flp
MLRRLLNDEAGAILSAELVLIMTILVIGMIVGLAELQNAVVNELNDIGDAIGSLNQSFFFHGHSSTGCNGLKAVTFGTVFRDRTDDGDGNECAISCDRPVPETPKDCN